MALHDHEKALTTKKKERRPDILTIQTGMHACWHADPAGLYSTFKETKHIHDRSQRKEYGQIVKNVRLQSIEFEHDKKNGHNRLCSCDSGDVRCDISGKWAGIENCILKLNRATTAAHNMVSRYWREER